MAAALPVSAMLEHALAMPIHYAKLCFGRVRSIDQHVLAYARLVRKFGIIREFSLAKMAFLGKFLRRYSGYNLKINLLLYLEEEKCYLNIK